MPQIGGGMLFGKIEYLNLLPFHIFMKRFARSSQQKMSMEYKRGVPAVINKKFASRAVDAAFVSSIRGRGRKHLDLGIIARDEVLSVLVIPDEVDRSDKESETSNLLAKVLGIKGEVIIGDKALRYYLSGGERVDLALLWKQKRSLPFVFALFCYHKDASYYKKIEKNFKNARIKIPQYILEEASKRVGVGKKEILWYLEHISYKLDLKAKMGLKKFYKEVDLLRVPATS